ncbi:hypothetical protein, partial [Amycolatopsis sp. NPDC059021]|uniref:hypothetical protein n=1 Tax=Amycolatopsis sp. NPDC059021 TaxID=3346704 RepID=UPI003672F893
MRHHHDLIVQFRHNLVRDVQKRAVNESLRDNLALATPVTRVVAQRIPPFQAKAHWDSPDLAIAGECLRLSAKIRGGARHSLKGINLIMEGAVHTDCRPEIVFAKDGRPVARLTAPPLSALRLADLKLSYPGDEDALSWFDARLERTLLRPVLGKKLMKRLAGLPLTYLPDAVPPRQGAATVAVDPHTETLSLTLGRAGPAPRGGFLSDPAANLAVAYSETGLNDVLARLCERELASGTTVLDEDLVSWRWTWLKVAFTAHEYLHLSGEVRCGGTTLPVDATAVCSLSSAKRLSVSFRTLAASSAEAGLLAEATAELLGRVFAGPAPVLRQRFRVPGTAIAVDAPVVAVTVKDRHLVAHYDVPLDDQRSLLTIDDAKPKPRIVQPIVPRQAAPGAPVVAHLDATLAKPTEPPYDYVWRTGNGARLKHGHGPVATVTSAKALLTGGTEPVMPLKLATVRLQVVDLLGRVGETEFDATYHPAFPLRHNDDGEGAVASTPPSGRRTESTRHGGPTMRGPRVVPLSAVTAAVIALGGGAVGGAAGGLLGGNIGYERGLHDPAADRRGAAGPPRNTGAPRGGGRARAAGVPGGGGVAPTARVSRNSRVSVPPSATP